MTPKSSFVHYSLLGLCVTTLVGCASRHQFYGQPMTMSYRSATEVKKILAHPNRFDGREICVVGDVASVCAKKGCWLRLGDASTDGTLFVKFTCPVEGRLIPKEAVGKRAWVQGTLKVGEITEATARHYAEDANLPPEQISKIVGSQPELKMKAPSARIEP